MLLYARNKKLKVNLNGKVYKIMNSTADLVNYYKAQINSGSKTINDIT